MVQMIFVITRPVRSHVLPLRRRLSAAIRAHERAAVRPHSRGDCSRQLERSVLAPEPPAAGRPRSQPLEHPEKAAATRGPPAEEGERSDRRKSEVWCLELWDRNCNVTYQASAYPFRPRAFTWTSKDVHVRPRFRAIFSAMQDWE
jgi:hypothetical protein